MTGARGPRRTGGGEGPASPPLLEVRDLVTRFTTRRTTVHAVNGVSFTLDSGESLALVGESGSGKSVSALSVLGLVSPPGRIVNGEIRLRGQDLRALDAAGWRKIRGREIAMVFQDPMTSLNPVLPVGRQIREVLELHLGMDRASARAETERLLTRVGIPDASRRLDDAPHTFSGGQRQRIMIAMALACRPAVLLADEPTTALDVTVQAQIVDLVRELQAELGMAVLWITHDLALVAGLVDRVAVLYAGSVVEEAPTAELFRNPRHPYTRGLMAALPRVEPPGPTEGPPRAAPDAGKDPGTKPASRRLETIEGRPPILTEPPDHCAFAPRCPWASERCTRERPPLRPVHPEGAPPAVAKPLPSGTEPREGGPSAVRVPGHRSACWHWESLP